MHSTSTLPPPTAAFRAAWVIGGMAALALVAGSILYAIGRSPAAPTGMMMVDGTLRPTAHTISSDALPHVAGKNITTQMVEFPPGGASPPHHHGGSVTVYVLSGTIRSQITGQPPMVYTQGQAFFEPPGVTHLVAENMSKTEPARILAVFVADEGATLTTYHE